MSNQKSDNMNSFSMSYWINSRLGIEVERFEPIGREAFFTVEIDGQIKCFINQDDALQAGKMLKAAGAALIKLANSVGEGYEKKKLKAIEVEN